MFGGRLEDVGRCHCIMRGGGGRKKGDIYLTSGEQKPATFSYPERWFSLSFRGRKKRRKGSPRRG